MYNYMYTHTCTAHEQCTFSSDHMDGAFTAVCTYTHSVLTSFCCGKHIDGWILVHVQCCRYISDLSVQCKLTFIVNKLGT